MLLNEIAMTRHERGQILKLKTQLESLTTQNAKYREALEKIFKDAGKFTASYEIAREALGEAEKLDK